MSTDLSITVTAAVPSADPFAFKSSKSIITYSSSSSITVTTLTVEYCKLHLGRYIIIIIIIITITTTTPSSSSSSPPRLQQSAPPSNSLTF